jgi:hypothetical protein
LFLPPELPALEEHGIPVQVGLKVENQLHLNDGLDEAIASLKLINLGDTPLSPFERGLVDDARSAM